MFASLSFCMLGPTPAFAFPHETTVNALPFGPSFARPTFAPMAQHSVAIPGVQS